MPALRKFGTAALLGLAVMMPGAAQAAPPSLPPPAGAAGPDYGGRDSAMPAAAGEAAPDPAASAGRALEALVVVLAGVAGTVYVLKRFGLVKPGADGRARITGPMFGRAAKDAASAVALVSSQTLPGGGMLHVVRVGERTLLLGATAQNVTAITEWDTVETPAPTLSDDFEDYLTRADPAALNPAASGIAAANARLRSLLSPKQPEEPS